MRYGVIRIFCGKTRRELFSDAAEQAADIFDADGCKHAEKRNVGVQITGAYFKQELKDGEADPSEPQDI